MSETTTELEPARDRIQPVDLQMEMQRSYLDYAMSVIVGRALPDVRDGLKPVHRRVLYAMYDGGYRPTASFSKSSRVVGEVMGNYHPHGDAAIYDALARLVQWWSLRYPLVAGQGNFGTPGNLGPAAPRYTECKMAPLAMEMVRDIDEDSVDFQDNYDGRNQEPVILPSRFPNLLVNGSEGIAVGMATRIPPHNLREVARGVQWFLDHPYATREELLEALLEIIPGPDFPTGATILGRRGIEDAYRTGRGSITHSMDFSTDSARASSETVSAACADAETVDASAAGLASSSRSSWTAGSSALRVLSAESAELAEPAEPAETPTASSVETACSGDAADPLALDPAESPAADGAATADLGGVGSILILGRAPVRVSSSCCSVTMRRHSARSAAWEASAALCPATIETPSSAVGSRAGHHGITVTSPTSHSPRLTPSRPAATRARLVAASWRRARAPPCARWACESSRSTRSARTFLTAGLFIALTSGSRRKILACPPCSQGSSEAMNVSPVARIRRSAE